MTIQEAIRRSMETGEAFQQEGDIRAMIVIDGNLCWADGLPMDDPLRAPDILAEDWEMVPRG